MYYAGRKKVVILTNLCFFILLLLLDTQFSPKIEYATVLFWMAARLLMYISTLVFVAELVHPKWRALFISTSYISECIGSLVSYYLPSENRVRWTISLLVATAALILSLRAPETPYWLAIKGRQEEAQQNFEEIRGEEEDEAERDEMLEAAEVDSTKRSRGLLRNVFSKEFFTPFLVIGFTILATSFMCAFNVSLSATLLKIYEENIKIDARLNNFLVEEVSSMVSAIVFCLLSTVLRRRILYVLSITLHVISLMTNILAIYGNSVFAYLSLFCSAIEQLGSQPIRVLLFTEVSYA